MIFIENIDETSVDQENYVQWTPAHEDGPKVITLPYEPLDENGDLLVGYVEVGRNANGTEFHYDVTRSVELPNDAVYISGGPDRYDAVNLGQYKDRILEARWRDADDEPQREKMNKALARNPNVTIEEADIRPFKWAGE